MITELDHIQPSPILKSSLLCLPRSIKDKMAHGKDQKPSGTSTVFKYFVGQNIAGQIAKQFSAPGLVLPWVFVAIGGPHYLAALILPLNNAGAFISQLMSASVLNIFTLRKKILLILNMAIGLLLIFISMTTMNLPLEWALILFLPMTLALGLCNGTKSVALQDLTAKTFGKEGMRKLLSLGNTLGGLLTLILAAITHFLYTHPGTGHSHLLQIWMGAVLFIISGLFFFGISEKESPARPKKKTKSGFEESFLLLKNSTWYIRYLGLQTLFLSVSLAIPFYSIHATTLHKNSANTLTVFIFAMALGALVSKFFWDPLHDRGVRFQFVMAAALAGVGALYSLIIEFTPALQTPYYHAPAFFLIGLAVKGLSVAQTVYLNSNVSMEERPKYLGMNGAIMALLGIAGSFLVGVLATMTHIKYALMALLILNIVAALFAGFPSSLTENGHTESR